jgi:site-specific DNA recombinase
MARSTTTHRSTKTTMATLGDDVRVGIYVRRSTDDEHQPYSLEAQDARLTAYIEGYSRVMMDSPSAACHT